MPIVKLTTYDVYNSLATDLNIVGTFSSDASMKFTDRHVSAPLINYVEPYTIDGVEKTLFYTEVNTNLNVGDRVFIINGNYDSNELIKVDKYKKGTDGYIVLLVDRCRVVLDIDYTGVLPNRGAQVATETNSDFIKVYYIDSWDLWNSANRQLTSRGGYFGGKFDFYQNNIAFVDSDLINSYYDNENWTKTAGRNFYQVGSGETTFSENTFVTKTGFFVRQPLYVPNNNIIRDGRWVNITENMMIGSFSIASSEMNPKTDLRFYNNNKMLVMERDFSYQGVDFIAGNVYKWDSLLGRWVVDVKVPSAEGGAIITRTNFRSGDFEGSFYSGVYGSKDKKLNWTGKGTWFGGTLFNVSWLSGSMFSTISIDESWKATLGRDLKATQKLNSTNNGGYGWNYVIESEFESTSIYSAIVRKTRFGKSGTLPVVEDYLNSRDSAFEHILTDGLFESCYFNNTKLIGGAVKNSRSKNTLMEGVKHINSWAKNSVFNKSTLIADSNIKILAYDEWTASEKRLSSTFGDFYSDDVDFKVYKFYITELDFMKLKAGDSFYLKGIYVDRDPLLLNVFDRKFTIGNWTEFVDEFAEQNISIINVKKDHFYKKGFSCAAFLVTPEENEYIYNSVEAVKLNQQTNQYVTSGFITDTIGVNPNAGYSIDIFVSRIGTDKVRTTQPLNSPSDLDFNYPSVATSGLTYIRPAKIRDRVDITNAFVIDAGIESGLVDNSVWNNGYDISYNRDLIITPMKNNMSISTYDGKINGDGTITFNTLKAYNSPSDYFEIIDRESKFQQLDIKVGEVIFTSGLDYYSRGKVTGVAITDPGTQYTDNLSPTFPEYSSASASRSGYGLSILYTTINAGINNVTIVDKGIDYNVGDVVYVRVDSQGSQSPNIGRDAYLTITSVDKTPPVRLPDAWKIVSIQGSSITVEPAYNKSVIAGLTDSGVFMNTDANNRWGRFTRTKINATKIKSGIFRRSSLTNNVIENDFYDPTDRDFTQIDKIKSLVVAEGLFNSTGNKLSNATYFMSSIVGGTDEWLDGIIYRSVLNKMTFNKGVIKESSWLDGTFNGGLFYSSRSYDGSPGSPSAPKFYYQDRILSSHKSGKTVDSPYNDRYSWRTGSFNGGEFFKSDWENGKFNDGLFNNAKWYGGTAYGGKFGKTSTLTSETAFYNGTVEFTTVENATFVADDRSATGVTNSILWKNGIFNSGVFGANRVYLSNDTSQKKSYSIAKTIAPNLPGTSKDYDLPVTGNHANIERIDVTINLLTESDLSAFRIDLMSPAGNKMLMKDFKECAGKSMKGTTLTSDKAKQRLTIGSDPYIGRYRFTLDFQGQILGNDYVQTLDELVENSGTDGLWKIVITNINTDTELVEFEAVVDFLNKQGDMNFIENSAIWENGIFNSGQFINYAYWRNGVFNNGRFTSTAGWERSGLPHTVGASYSHTWHNGFFNGGIFGNENPDGGNSTWFNGMFNNGTFIGRLWNDGIFRNGTFKGSGLTANGGWKLEDYNTRFDTSNKTYAEDFTESFEGDFYGLWRNGLVSDATINSGTTPATNTTVGETTKIATFEDVLWKDGLFEHSRGSLDKSVWLSGTFSNGEFRNGSFNPYVKRNGEDVERFDTKAVWTGGTLRESDFFFSEWRGGQFISGTALGAWFKEGTSFYMNAFNVVWGNTNSYPVWKNGNWFGSEFIYLGSMSSPAAKTIVSETALRNRLVGITDLAGTATENKIHIWNIFEDPSTKDTNFLSVNTNDGIRTRFPNYQPVEEVWLQNDNNGYFDPPIVWTL